MAHLNSEELIDLAEGTRTASLFPHLGACDRCQRQLAELRGALAVVNLEDDRVPEPSPLFWDHLSARVRDAVAAEGAPATAGWTDRWLTWKIAMPLVACIAILIAVTVSRRPATPSILSTTGSGAEAVSLPVDFTPDAPSVDDSSWSLMTDLAGDLDWDAAVEAGLAGSAGEVDRAVFDLSLDERLELERLLKEELARSGA